ncbi:MAG: hypothetical protein EOP04_12580 [Proteobacteria bacterium]|nr:MAG: hypothetical protein EOP04_12580 [Pseudomonadota bacterium]
MRFFLSSYTFTVRPKGRKDEFCVFNNLPGTPKTLQQIIKGCIDDLVRDAVDHDHTSTSHRAEDVGGDSHSVWGILQSGTFGESAHFRNLRTKQRDFERKPEHAEEVPYYFQFHFPAGSNKGILVTQRTGAYGIHTAFKKIIHDHLSQRYNLMLELNEIIPPELHRQLHKPTGMSQVVFNHQTLPNHAAKSVGWSPEEVEEIAEVIMIVKAKTGKTLPISNLLRGRYTNLIEKRIVEDDELSRDVEVVVNYGRSSRKIRLNNPDPLTPLIDISEELENRGTTPVFEIIHRSADLLIAELSALLTGEDSD